MILMGNRVEFSTIQQGVQQSVPLDEPQLNRSRV